MAVKKFMEKVKETENIEEVEITDGTPQETPKEQAQQEATIVEDAPEKKAARIAAYYEEYVDFYAIKDNHRYRDDIYVAVNGESCLIKRGVPVKIKRKFYEAIKNSMDQDAKTAMMIEGLKDEYRAAQNELN